jgi:hypothetical protein
MAHVTKAKASVRSIAPAKHSGGAVDGPQAQTVEGGGAYPWPMLPWMMGWAEFWSAWLGGVPQLSSAGRASQEREGRRQEDGLPWLPKVEATVIPLRRRSDPPEGQASRISLRVQIPVLPWLGVGNVIAIDTTVLRPMEGVAEPAPAPAPASGGKTDWS